MLSEASDKSKKYEWMAAATLYQKAIDTSSPEKSSAEVGRLLEQLAKCYFKGAFQSESRQEFKQKMAQSARVYENAQDVYKTTRSESMAHGSQARAIFSKFWIEDDAEPRRILIQEAISLMEKSAESSIREGDSRRVAEAHRDLLNYLGEALELCLDWKNAKDYFDKAIGIGEKAIKEFQQLDDEALVECLYKTLYVLCFWFDFLLEPSEATETANRTEVLSKQLAEAAQKSGTSYSLSIANDAIALRTFNFEEDLPRGVRLLEEGLTHAQKTRDSLLIGDTVAALEWSGTALAWNEDDLGTRKNLLNQSVSSAQESRKNLEVSLRGSTLALITGTCARSYRMVAMLVDTDVEEKKAHLRKSIEIGNEALVYDNYSGIAWHEIPSSMHLLAAITSNIEEKQRLLKDALALQENVIRKVDRILRPDSPYRGQPRIVLGQIKAELSNLSKEQGAKVELVQSAASDMREGLALIEKWLDTPAKGFTLPIRYYLEVYGKALWQLYSATHNAATAQEAIRAFEQVIKRATEAGLIGSIAPLEWKVAEIYDTLGDYRRASESFGKAAEKYRLGAQKIRGSAPAFEELAYYMEAWSNIEDARLHHTEEQYLSAAEKYSKAASLLESTKAWAHLGKHYVACSFLEGGEALSRQERLESSIESLTSAMRTFQEAKVGIQRKLVQTSTMQDKTDTKNWLEITDSRLKLCKGRIELEEAKLLDRKGEEEASGAKYLLAAETFKDLLRSEANEEARREVETLMLFCKAWAMMKQAEVGASPEQYSKASNAFLNAKDISNRKKPRMLALANASMCKALEAGTLFRQTRNTQLYSDIKKHLDAAADYYQQGGFQSAADWTQATQRLFDALVYMADAEVERDPKKKTEFYHLSEKHLQMAASLYGDAGYPSKKEEALKHLKRARGEKELLLTPIEALAENPAVTKTTMTPVSLTRDQAVGLESFEAANVVGNISLDQKEVGVGAEVMLELEMANVGKTPATLIKLENIATEGIELDRQKTTNKLQDNFVDLKGKRLEYFKTHEVKIPLKATRKGSFQMRPRILFVDEKGSYRSYDFEPVSITVRELGISGWLKGPK